jgi:acetyltransferase-like isoleucine patch superfamily enzyme
MFKIIKLLQISFLKTIFLNFHFLKFRDAIKFPIICGRSVKLREMSGKIVFNQKITFGIFRIGIGNVGIFNPQTCKGNLQIIGTIVLRGTVRIGRGSSICVSRKDAVLKFNGSFNNTASSNIVCYKSISFGNDVLVSWNSIIMDTDGHSITDASNSVINSNKEIVVGNHVWICMNVMILKGVIIPDGCVLAAGAHVTKRFSEKSLVIGGYNEILKRDIHWNEEKPWAF